MNLNILAEFDIKFKKYDKKRTPEGQLNDLFNELKQIGVKIIDTSKFQNGYGEGVCLILTQLLDKYLINQNFIFKKPKYNDDEKNELKIEEIQNEFEEVILEETPEQQGEVGEKNNILTMNNFSSKTNFYFRNSAKATGKKRWNSGMSNLTQGTEFF